MLHRSSSERLCVLEKLELLALDKRAHCRTLERAAPFNERLSIPAFLRLTTRVDDRRIEESGAPLVKRLS